MKVGKKIWIPALLLALMVPFCLWYYLGIFSEYNHFSAQKDIESGIVRILYIGEPASNPDEESLITREFGFEHYNLGCSYSDQLNNSINAYNKVVADYLDEINEPGWEGILNKRLDSLANAAL